MTLTEILKKRRSVRKFDGRPVPRETIESILKLTLTTAPSSKNTRSTRFMVVDDPGTLVRIAAMRDFGSAFVADAPCGVLVMGDGAIDLWVDNASISATILQLAAEEAGLGSCWVHVNGRPRWSKEPSGGWPVPPGNLDETAADYLREFLPIPSEWKPLCFVALGYPAETPKPHGEKDDSDKIIWL